MLQRFFRFLWRDIVGLVAGGAILLFGWHVWGSSDALLYDSGVRISSADAPPAEEPVEHISTPKPLRAVYMSSWVAGTESVREPLLRFVENSEVNAVMIDIKDYTGKISFPVENKIIDAVEADERRIPDIRTLIKRLHEKNLYVIGRVSVFQDPYIARRVPEIAVKDSRGGIWKDKHGLNFVDPGAEYYWSYMVEIAREAEHVGFDEVNFDYIRYPSDGALKYAIFPYAKGRERSVVLEDFFKYLRTNTRDLGIPISADVFGLTTYSTDDLGIGQILEKIVPYFDYVAPMVYPSHYAPGFEGYKNPAEHPYEIILISMKRGVERLKAINEDPQKLRPWIQDFDLGAEYGAAEIFKQKQAIHDAGLDSWMSWDPANKYTKEAYKKQ